MSDTLFENFTTGDDDYNYAYNTDQSPGRRLFQTFTTTSRHTVTSVKLKLYRLTGEDPGTVAAYIYATSAGVPTGSALASGTVVGTTLTEGSPGALIEITFSPGANLVNATTYAIVLTASSATAAANWRIDNNHGYEGGTFGTSTNGGAWTDAGVDGMFEVYGIAAVETTIDTQVGEFTLTGNNILLTKALNIATTVGAFALTGIDILLIKAKNYFIDTLVGTFTLTGNNIILALNKWVFGTKHTSTYTNQSKNTSTWTEGTKNSSSWTFKDKN